MKKIITYLLFAFLAVSSLSSCTEKEKHNIGIPEGEKASISLSVKNMDPEIINATKGMTTPEEQNIASLFVMIFNSDGTLVTNHGFTDMSSLTMNAFSGSGMQIYAVANYISFASELSEVATINQLNDFVKMGIGDSAGNPGHLVLVGNTSMNILPGNANTASIDLYYITAKITVKYIDNTTNQDITFFGWEIFDLPVKSYLLDQSSDAVDPSVNADFYSITGNNQWEKEEVLGGKHTVSESFYMFENRRGAKAGAVNDYKKKAEYAVEFPKATYFKASFNCLNRTDGNTYSVVTKVYLGADNYSDFNIQRGKHYTYTITISGVNSITVEVSTDSNSSAMVLPLSITTSSSMTMDAHPDMRVINIKGDNAKIANVSIEVLNNESWLKLSPLNLTLHQVSQSTPEASLYQQPSPSGAAGYFVRPRFIPHKSFREANQSLAWSEWPTAGDTDYDDDQMEFAAATYRMCYKISSLPIYDEDGQAICIYADEYAFTDGTSSRSAKLRIRYDDLQDDGVTKYVDYEIIQKQAMPIGPVVDAYSGTSTSYKLAVIEQIEESALILYPNLSNFPQQTIQMQWGGVNTGNYHVYRNGYNLTSNIVYTDPSAHTTYRTKYGSGVFNGVTGAITEPAYASNNSGAPYYTPNINSNAKNNLFYNPVFNSSAARYCHEKNRDLNGDGIVDDSETEWYLPSQHELYQVWISLEAIRYSTTEFGTGYYWSSSEGGSGTAYVIGFQTGYTDKNPRNKNSMEVNHINNNDVVRCIRKVNTTVGHPILLDNAIIDCSDMPANAITNISKGSAASGSLGNGKDGEETISQNAATAYYMFQVAKDDLSKQSWTSAIGYSSTYTGSYPADTKLNKPAGSHNNVSSNATYMRGAEANANTGCRSYWEGSSDNTETGIGKWRLPNKRELYLMWIYKDQLEAQNGFSKFKKEEYWSASERAKNSSHYVSFGNGSSTNPSKSTLYRVRCIREL